MEAKQEAKQEPQGIAAHREKRVSGSSQVWLPSGPTHASSTPRRPPAAGSLSQSSLGAIKRPSGGGTAIKRRTTTESVMSTRSGAELPPQAAPAEISSPPARTPAEASAHSAPAAPSTPMELLDFWAVLQQTQRNLNDMLVRARAGHRPRPEYYRRATVPALMM